ncbi:MAG: hypothetical protein O7J95_19980, partial [Planctomycetota bacterium]|nr:hypothetical protein [Planctomycetota bacterium]
IGGTAAILAAILVCGAVVAILVGQGIGHDGAGHDGTGHDDDVPGGGTASGGAALDRKMAAVEERLGAIESRLGELLELRAEIQRLARTPGAAPRELEKTPTDGGNVDAESPSEDRGGREARLAAAQLVREGGEERLRSFVTQVIGDERVARTKEHQQQAEDRRRHLAQLRQGPYGRHNYKVNSMSERLDLSERQKQYYYESIVAYVDQVAETREAEKRDTDNRQVYRDRRQELRSEFVRVITQTLSPEQAEIFASLSEHEQRPDDGYGGYGATIIMRSSGDEGLDLLRVTVPTPDLEFWKFPAAGQATSVRTRAIQLPGGAVRVEAEASSHSEKKKE